MKRRIGDRRDNARFEILGDLWGRIDTTAPMVVQNICRGGALLDSPSRLPRNSVHWVTVLAGGQRHVVQIRVCHVSAKAGSGSRRYVIGVEFLSSPQAVLEAFAAV